MYQSAYFSSQHHLPVGIQPDQHKKQCGKRNERGSSVTHEGEGNAYNRNQPDGHADINEDMKEKNRSHTIGITPAECASLPFRNEYDPHDHEQVKQQQ
jgi:hypothetical protein